MNRARLHLICIVAMFSLLMPNLMAQQTFRIYRNDGTMNVFFYSNLDSITFSAGNDPATPLIQNFHTPDSVYQVPVNEIDSVSFNPIPTIYKNSAVKIEGRLRDYVTGCDSLTLFVKSTIPEELLPACGDNIATLECDDVLPYGFIGKVENIVRGDDVINIECSKVSLLDVFDSLSLEVCASSDEEPSTSRSRAGIWPPVKESLTIPPLKKTLPLSHEIEAAGGLSGTYDMTAFGELSTQSCDIYLSLLITPVPFQSPEVNFNFTYTAQNSITVGGSFSSSVKISKEFTLESVRNIRIPGVAAVTEIFSEAGLFMEFEGKMGMNGSYTKPFTTVIHMSYNNKTPSAIPPTFRMIGRDPVIENSLEGSAAITLGLYGKLGIAMFCKELSAIIAGFKTGITFSASIDPSTGVAPIETPNTEMYDELNRDDFLRGDISLVGEIYAELLGNEILSNSLEVGDLFFRNPVYRRGVVPLFEEVSLNDEGEPGVLTASAKLKRKLISDVPVGFALYDDNKKFVDKWWADFKYKENEGASMTHKFEGLSANKSYTLHPITRAFNDNMVANPEAYCKTKENEFGLKVRYVTDPENRLIKKWTINESNSKKWRIDIDADFKNLTRYGTNPNDVILKTYLPGDWDRCNVEYYYQEEGCDIIHPSRQRYAINWGEEGKSLEIHLNDLKPLKEYTVWVDVKTFMEGKLQDVMRDSIEVVNPVNINENRFVDMGTGVLWASRNPGAYTCFDLSGKNPDTLTGGRTPTLDEYKDLFLNCELFWCDTYDIWNNTDHSSGFLLQAKNGNTIYIPLESYRYYSVENEDIKYYEGSDPTPYKVTVIGLYMTHSWIDFECLCLSTNPRDLLLRQVLK